MRSDEFPLPAAWHESRMSRPADMSSYNCAYMPTT